MGALTQTGRRPLFRCPCRRVWHVIAVHGHGTGPRHRLRPRSAVQRAPGDRSRQN